jgi:hypothetical protein
MIERVNEWRKAISNGETLFSLLDEDFASIHNPPVDTVNAIIQESPTWDRRVILKTDDKSTICIPTVKGWLVLDKPLTSPKYKPHILGAIAAENDKYIRETYILSGMTEHDVLNYLEEL